MQQNIGRVLTMLLILLFIGFLFFSIVDTMLLSFYLEMVNLIVHLPEEAMAQLSIVLLTFITMFIFYLIFTLILIGLALVYHTLLEIKEANYLKERIKSIGLINKIKGLEKESS